MVGHHVSLPECVLCILYRPLEDMVGHLVFLHECVLCILYRPLEDMVGHHVFLLEAIDSGGRSVTDSLKIHVEQPKQARNYNHR